jgi:hypothetical protein
VRLGKDPELRRVVALREGAPEPEVEGALWSSCQSLWIRSRAHGLTVDALVDLCRNAGPDNAAAGDHVACAHCLRQILRSNMDDSDSTRSAAPSGMIFMQTPAMVEAKHDVVSLTVGGSV